MRAFRLVALLLVTALLLPVAARAANDGPIVVDGRTFASWTDFFTSEYFRANGKRCGTQAPRSFGGPGILGGPGDCSLGLTNPLPEYEPGLSCEITVVVHRLESVTGDGVFPDSLVRTQIAVLNEDFQAIPASPGADGYNSRIRFKLATRDPNGNPHPGFTRTTNEFWFNDAPDPVNGTYYDALAWDPHKYLNIYTLSPIAPGGLVLGYVPYLPQESGGSLVGSSDDGVRCLWNAFGRPAANAPYHLGRTVTHEVGHWLGLYHTFQDGCGTTAQPGCYSTGDRVCDTNPEAAEQFGCPVGEASCGLPDPIHNYMDYTDDICMNQFSHEQVRRVICTMRHYRPQICRPDQPTATLVQRFVAVSSASGDVDLTWAAHVDADIVGWNLYRSAGQAWTRVNDAPIALDGLSEFRYTDRPGLSGTVRYRLTGIAPDQREFTLGSTSLELGGPVHAFAAAIVSSNPARGPLTVGYSLPQPSRVRVEVFSVSGQRVRTLVDEERGSGRHAETFELRGAGARRLAPGVYTVRVSAGNETRSLRLIALD